MPEQLTIKAWRVNAGYRQQDVADILNVSRQTVIDWERGEVKPKGLVIYALAYLYETKVDLIKV